MSEHATPPGKMSLVYKIFIGFQEDQCVMRDIASQVTAGSKKWVSWIFGFLGSKPSCGRTEK